MLRRRPGITDRQGTDTLGAGRIPETMKKTGVREVDDEVRKIRSLGFEMVRLPIPENEKVIGLRGRVHNLAAEEKCNRSRKRLSEVLHASHPFGLSSLSS